MTGMPVGRIPRLIGSATNLPAGSTSYPTMVKWDVPIIPTFYTMTAGNLAVSLPIQFTTLCFNQSQILGVFQEYCLVGFRFELRINATVNQSGLIVVIVDEKVATAPNDSCFATPHLELICSNTESPSRHMISWRAKDYLDLDWTSTSSGADVPCWLKLFASTAAAPAGTGTTGTTSCQVCITGSVAMCFRGFEQ
jgi:hypothetical protein